MRTLSRPLGMALAALVLLAAGSPAAAQTAYSWNYAGSNWHTGANWSPTGVPTAADTAILGPFDGTTYTLPALSATAAVRDFRIIGPRPQFTGTLSGGGNTLTVGSGGAMTTAPLTERGAFGHTLTLNNLAVNVADGTSFTGTFSQTAGAMELSGFASRIALENGSQLRLVNTAGTANYDLSINGGAQLFLNPGTRVTNGVGENSAGQGEIRFHGGGQLNFQGADATSGGSVTTTFNANQVVAASGHSSVGVFTGSNSGPNTANIVVNLGNGTLQRGIDRFSDDTAGNFLSLGTGTIEFTFNGVIPGFAGSRAELFLSPGGSTIPVTNGVIVQNTSSNGNSPYVILTGSIPSVSGVTGRFATWNSATQAVTAQMGTIRTELTISSAVANENVVYRPTNSTANATLTASISPQTIVFEPVATGQSVNLGGFTLTTPGIMVERILLGQGNFNFSLTGGTITSPASGAPINVFVLGSSNTFFNVGATFSNSSGSVVKSGLGTMVLTGNTPQMNSVLDIYINQGAIRARIDGGSANLGTTNVLNLRGGVLEVDASGGTSTFSRGLGRGFNQVNWNFATSTMVGDRGGGGFAVVNGNLNVNIGGAGQTLVWNGSSGGNEFFIRSGQALRLGSFQQTGLLTFQNSLALDDGSAGLPPESREIITEASSSFLPLYAQRSRITGVISGSSATGLMKVGPGTLELTAANTYAGGTTVGAGALVVNNTTGSATGTGRVIAYGLLMGNGIIAPSGGNGVTFLQNPVATFPTLALNRDQFGGTPGHLTIGSAGANNPVTFRPGSITFAQLNGTTFDPNGGSTSYSRLTVRGTGAVTVGGATLSVGLNNGFTPSNTDVFGILDNQTGNAITGTFDGIGEGGVVNAVFLSGAAAGTFQVTYQGDITAGGIAISGGNDIVLYNFTPVPEPAAVVALCAGAVGLLRVVRRVRRQPASVTGSSGGSTCAA